MHYDTRREFLDKYFDFRFMSERSKEQRDQAIVIVKFQSVYSWEKRGRKSSYVTFELREQEQEKYVQRFQQCCLVRIDGLPAVHAFQ